MCGGFINTDAKYLEKSWLKCVECCLIQAQKAFLASSCLHVFQTFIQTVQNLSAEGSQEKTGESSIVGTTVHTDSDQTTTEYPTGKRQSSYQSQDSALPEEAAGASRQEEKVSKQCLSVFTTDVRCEDKLFINRLEQAEVEEQKERHNIIIIDQITEAERYSWSTEILKEVNTFAPKVQVKYAYSLAKGGVAIHTYNLEDKRILLQSLAGKAFSGAKISDLSEKEDIVFLKNIPTYIDTSVISTALQGYKIKAIKVERNQHRRTGRPQPVVRVFCQAIEAQKLLRYTSLSVGNVVCDVVKKRANVLRCYNCQQFGHIARACVNQKRCVNCSGFHTSDSYTVRGSQSAQIAVDYTGHHTDCALHYKRDMRCLQANLRSFHTSRNLLEMCTAVRKSKLLLAQEIWAEKESITLRDFHPPLIKSRVNKEGGGVAIFVHKTVKWVQLTKYDIAGLEAVWAEVEIANKRAVIGSVYIPPGQNKQIELLRNQLRVICDENSTVIVGMDANARHPLWDFESQQASGVSKQMGQRLADLLAENGMEILNDGSHTYHKGQYSSALDVTAVKGLTSEMNTT